MWHWSGHSKHSFIRIIQSCFIQSCYYVGCATHFLFFRSCASFAHHSCNFIRVGWSSLFIRTSFKFKFQVQSRTVTSRGIHSNGALHLYVRHHGVPSHGIFRLPSGIQLYPTPDLTVNSFCYLHYIIYHFQELLQCAQLPHHVGGSSVGHKM
jgi:hypothetical protein